MIMKNKIIIIVQVKKKNVHFQKSKKMSDYYNFSTIHILDEFLLENNYITFDMKNCKYERNEEGIFSF